jgi:hypothetical protein
MKNKYLDQNDEFHIGEEKTRPISKIDGELFDDKSYILHDLINVRRLKGSNWEVLKNKKSAIIIKGYRFSKKELNFLNKPEGILFIINTYKSGAKSVSDFKKAIAKCV